MKKDDRQKSVWRTRVDELKVLGASALLFVSSLSMFGQKNYNDKCNGSLAWLSSTTETRGSTNPAATISPGSTYHGINQLDGYNVSRLIKFINQNDIYKPLQGKLSVTKTKGKNKKGQVIDVYRVNDAQWKALAASQSELFTQAQEDFLCQIYLPECFGRLQKSLITDAKNKKKTPIMLSDIHPVVLSLFARSYVKGPYSSAPFTALKNAGSLEKINSEAFITKYTSKNSYLQNKALTSFRDNTIQWKDAQLAAACSQAQKQAVTYLASVEKNDQTRKTLAERKQEHRQKVQNLNRRFAQAGTGSTKTTRSQGDTVSKIIRSALNSAKTM